MGEPEADKALETKRPGWHELRLLAARAVGEGGAGFYEAVGEAVALAALAMTAWWLAPELDEAGTALEAAKLLERLLTAGASESGGELALDVALLGPLSEEEEVAFERLASFAAFIDSLPTDDKRRQGGKWVLEAYTAAARSCDIGQFATIAWAAASKLRLLARRVQDERGSLNA